MFNSPRQNLNPTSIFIVTAIIIAIVIILLLLLNYRRRKCRKLNKEVEICKLLNSMAKERNSQVIALIDKPTREKNKQPSIDFQDNHDILELLHKIEMCMTKSMIKKKKNVNGESELEVEENKNHYAPIDLILHTPGGYALPALQIALALSKYPGQVNIFIPYYAFSAGTMLSLSGNEILMDKNASLGPIDLQEVFTSPRLLSQVSVSDALAVIAFKPISKINDETIMLAENAKKWTIATAEMITNIMNARGVYSTDAIYSVIKNLALGKIFPHDYPITVEHAKRIGLNVYAGDLPPQVYNVVDLVVGDDDNDNDNDNNNSCIAGVAPEQKSYDLTLNLVKKKKTTPRKRKTIYHSDVCNHAYNFRGQF